MTGRIGLLLLITYGEGKPRELGWFECESCARNHFDAAIKAVEAGQRGGRVELKQADGVARKSYDVAPRYAS